MGWPLRMFEEEGLYFVTSRCFQGRLLLRPCEQVNEVVGGVLARAIQRSADNVRLHAYIFASNHFHLLVWARGAALAGFMPYLRANLSKKVRRLVGWSGGFWERRYSAEPVLDETALDGSGGGGAAVVLGRTGGAGAAACGARSLGAGGSRGSNTGGPALGAGAGAIPHGADGGRAHPGRRPKK